MKKTDSGSTSALP